jgi:hypothetical protein
MKLLTFQTRQFSWTPFSKTLDDAPPPGDPTDVPEAVVAFMHVEEADLAEDGRARAFKKTIKHLKWLANKREMKNIVLHSFAHLGGGNADPGEALVFMEDVADRLRGTGYDVWITPFGYFCSWNIDVYGESLAKVFKSF